MHLQLKFPWDFLNLTMQPPYLPEKIRLTIRILAMQLSSSPSSKQMQVLLKFPNYRRGVDGACVRVSLYTPSSTAISR